MSEDSSEIKENPKSERKKVKVKDTIKGTLLGQPKIGDEVKRTFHLTPETKLYNLPAHRLEGFGNASLIADLIPWFEPNHQKVVRSANETVADELDAKPISFQIDQAVCNITRRAALVKARHGKHKGKNIVRYPAEREFDVLEALRLVGTHNNGAIGSYKGQAAIVFSVAQLKKKLNNKYHSNEVLEALECLHYATNDLKIKLGSTVITSRDSLLPTLSTISEGDFDAGTQLDDATHLCVLHPLLTSAIANLDMYQVHSTALIHSNSLMTRYLRQRLSLRWTQTSHSQPYTFKATTILRSYGYEDGTQERIKRAARPLLAAIERLSEGEEAIIDWHHIEEITAVNPTTGREKISDLKITLYPTQKFIDQQRRSLAIKGEKVRLLSEAQQTGFDFDDLT